MIFDLDGTLVDTERESSEGLARYVARLGITLDEADRAFVIGRSWNEIHRRMRERFGLVVSMAELIAGSACEREQVLSRGVRVLPGAKALVARLDGRVPLGMVSGSSRRELEFSLAKSGLAPAFPVTVAAEDCSEGKPSPEGYQHCARLLGVTAGECLVFEDSAPGIAAAKAAGMTCVAVRVANFAGHDQSHADVSLDTLEAADDAFLAGLGIP